MAAVPPGPKRAPGGMYGHPYRSKPFPFDLTCVGEPFAPVNPAAMAAYEEKLSAEVLAAAEILAPGDKERAELMEFIKGVRTVLEKIRSTTSSDYLPGVVLEEVHEVGSWKKDTMLRGHRVADIVVVTKSMPTFESVASIGRKLCEELSDAVGVVSMVSRDFGLVLTKREDKVRLLISTVQSNTNGLEADLHLSYEAIAANQAAIYHSRCFDEFSYLKQARPLIRIMKALRRRFPGLEPINIWAIESLVEFSLIDIAHEGAALSPGAAFKRALSVLAAGIFLPGASGLSDPVDHRYRLCDQLTYEDMDTACSTAQTLLRILCHGGANLILGTGTDKIPDVIGSVTVVGDVCVAPLEKAYLEPAAPPPATTEPSGEGGPAKNKEMKIEASLPIKMET